MATIKGGCVCGKVTYSGTAEPIFAGICHCKTCQKASGTAFNTVVAVPADAIKIPARSPNSTALATAARRRTAASARAAAPASRKAPM